MAHRLVSVRVALAALVLGLMFLTLAQSPVAAQEVGAEAEVYFQQVIDQSSGRTPVFGPESGDLGFEAYEDCPSCTWAAGVNLVNLHVHFDLAWPANSNLPVMVMAAVRQADPQALGVLEPNFVSITPVSWISGAGTGDFTTVPASVDIIATGSQGYFGVNGELLTTFDLSGIAGPGDIALTGAAIAAIENASLGISNFSIWDLDATTAEGQDVDSSDLDVGQGVTGEDWEKFDQYRVMALFQPMIFGPESGSLAHDPASVSFHDAGVAVTDFMAHATCSVSAPAPVDSWDCGFSFRDLEANHYSIAVLSNGEWWISEGTNDAFQNGEIQEFQIEHPQSMTIELVVVGATGYLGVNDRYVATLDLSSIPGPGTVVLGSAFYDSTTVEGGTTSFEDFGVVSLDDMQGAWYGAPEDGNVSETHIPGVSGNTYTDATFPFSLTWEDAWSVVDFANVDGTEMLTLTNGPVTADVYGAFNTIGAIDCMDRLVGYYQDQPGYSNVGYLLSQDGVPVISGDEDVALGTISMTVTDSQGVTQELYDYATCVTLGDGQSLVRIEQFVSPDDYLAQLEAMNALQLGLGFGEPEGGAVVPEESGEAASEPASDVEAAYLQFIEQTDAQAPVFGPAPAQLVPSFRPDGTWEAGISLRDIRLHADVVLPDADSDWGLMIAIRRGEVDPLITELMQDTDVILIDGSGDWETNQDSGFVLEPVASVDLIANGDDGYLAINGEFVTYVDMSLVIGPGEVVLAAITEGGEASPLDLENVTIWDLDAPEPAVEEPVSVQSDPAEPITVELEPAEDAANFDQLMGDALAQPAIYGPETGSLVHYADEATFFDAGVSVTNFAARVKCEAPAGGAPPVWDCAFFFRDPAGDHLRLIVLSSGEWSLTRGNANLIQSGEGVAAVDATGTGMTIDLVVSGDTGYFAVNSEFISTLYVAEVPGPGTVGIATGLFSKTFAIGAETGYTDFTVWSLDAPAPPDVKPAPSGISGSTYTSPSYGYSLTWDETWTVNTESSENGADHLSITNGPVTAVLSGTTEEGADAGDCFLNLIDGYLNDPAYSEVGFIMDEFGLPLVSGDEYVSSALLTFTITQEGAEGVEIWDYVMCAKVPDSGAIVHLEQLVAPESFMHQQDDMEWLQTGLHVVPTKSVSPPGLPDLSGVVTQPTEVDISNFAQMSSTPAETSPIAGPAPASLTLDQAAGNYWAAGIEATDVWIRITLPDSPSALSSEWQFQISYRAAGYGSDSVVLNSDGTWDAGQVQGTAAQMPATIDLVAFGETGYLAFDGTLVAMLNISTWMQPGDVIISAIQMGDVVPGATFEVTDISVWNMNFDDVQPAGATAVTYFPEDAAAFADLVLQAAASGQPVYGPTSGVMNHSPGLVTFQRTEVALTDFAARIVCLTPMTDVTWDCGFVFGNLDTPEQYRLAVVSDGAWYLSTGQEDPHVSGTVSLPESITPGSAPLTIDLIVQGGLAYLGVNGEYVATLDVAQFAGTPNVAGATAFFADTYVEGGVVLYEQFEVWSLDAAPTADIAGNPSGAANTYTSPNFGYSLAWNDTWTVVDEISEPGFDHLSLTNGSAYADLYSVDLDVEATACNEDLFAYYSSDSHYSGVEYLVDNAGNPLIVPGSDIATAWIRYTYTDDQGLATEYYDFAVCARLPDGSSMVQLELQATPADVEANVAAMEELVMGLNVEQVPFDILDVKGGGGLVDGVNEGDSSGHVTGRRGSSSGQPSDDDD